MLLKIRILFSTTTIALGLYVLLKDNPPQYIFTVMLLSLGATIFMTGLSEFEAKRKASALFSFISAAFVGFVSIYYVL